MNKDTFTLEFMLEWNDLSVDAQNNIIRQLEIPVWEKYKHEIQMDVEEHWSTMTEEEKKILSFKDLEFQYHMDRILEVASNLRDYVAMEVRIWTRN